MFTRGLTRGLTIDRKRILLRRTPLVIAQPTAAQKVNERIKAELIAKILERQSVGAGGKSAGTQKTISGTQRSSSSSSTTTSASTSRKTTTSPTVIEVCEAFKASLDAAIATWYPAISYTSTGCSIPKY